MARNTAIRGLQIKDTFFGNGLKRNVGDNDIAELALKTSGGLKIDTTELAIEPADFAGSGLEDDGLDNLQISNGGVTNAMLAGSISEAKLDINSAPTDGQVLYWNNSVGKLDYKQVTVDAVTNSEIKREDLSADVNVSGYSGSHTLANAPIANSVQVYLNGLLQQDGSGEDYQLSGSTITFSTQPESGDIIIVHYITS